MGEAKRRKQSDPNFGRVSKRKETGEAPNVIRQNAMTKNLIEPVEVMGSRVVSVHLMVSLHPQFFNQGFCQIKTEKTLITFWSNHPFNKSGSLLTRDREWSGTFTIQIVDNVASKCSKKFSMKNVPVAQNTPENQVFLSLNAFIDYFIIEDFLSVKVGTDLPPEEIDIQIPSMDLTNQDITELDTSCSPNYEELADLYLSRGLAPLQSAIFDWLDQNNFADDNPDDSLSNSNQIAMTVFDIASKKSKVLASRDLKAATFTLKVPFETQDYYSYQPVQLHLPLAKEAMALINTGFFNEAITELINFEQDSIKTLRQNAMILYMGANAELEIFDAACALARWKPFNVIEYVGEQRNNLNALIEKTFKPLANKIQDFRVKQKRADKFPCLSLLCIVENRTTGDICEFRRHFTAQSGNQLIIPGFSDGTDGVDIIPTPMSIIGEPKRIPSIRGFN